MGSSLAAFTAGNNPEIMATMKAIVKALNIANQGMAN